MQPVKTVLALYSRGSTAMPLPLETADGYAAGIAYFVECCREKTGPWLCPPEESARAPRSEDAMQPVKTVLTLYPRSSSALPPPLETAAGYAAEIAYFVECCRDRAGPWLCPPEESARAVRFLRLLLEARERPGAIMPCKL